MVTTVFVWNNAGHRGG